MTNEGTPGEDRESGAEERACVRCGHADSEHVERDSELPGRTLRRIYCEPCADWHDFLPAAEPV